MRKHIEEFVGLKCAPDLLGLGLFPNAKEITESIAAFDAMRRTVMPETAINYSDSDVKVICVGDGHTPRTAALFAMRTNWDCYSVDPVLRCKEYPIKRLTQIKDKIENIELDFSEFKVVIVCVHSHATIKNMLEHIKGKERHLITIPCCVPHDIMNREYAGFIDTNIWSEKNLIKIWMNV